MENLPPHLATLSRLIRGSVLERYDAYKEIHYDFWEMKYADPSDRDEACSFFVYLV